MRPLITALVVFAVLTGCAGRTSHPEVPEPTPAPAPTATPSAAPAGVSPVPSAPQVQRVPFVRASPGVSTRVQWRIPVREGQLTDSQLVALAPRIARLRAEPDSFVIGPNDSLALAQAVRVLAIADDGSVLGEIRRYSHQFSDLSQDSLGVMRPIRPGTAEWLAMIPTQTPGAFRTRGPAEVRIIVTDSAGRIMPEPPLPRGTARLSGVVTNGDGKPIVGALVRVSMIARGAPRRLALVGTDAEGRYDLRDLPAASLAMLVTGGARAPATAVVTLRDGEHSEHDFRFGGSPRD